MKDSLDTDELGLDVPDELIDEEKPEQGLELHIGSNVFRTTNGVVKLQGKEQFFFEVRPDPPALLLTMDIYDEHGQRIGHLRRNALSSAFASRFTLSVTSAPDASLEDPLTVIVMDRVLGHTVIEAYLFQKRKIRVTAGQFHTHKGDLVSISPHYCRIGTGLTRFGDVAECRGGTASIG
ncbi:MAG TPA: hypothetical protein VFS39_07855 [Nitrospira sp.]|nr:hypothetical protein [Nitrospira sp.]